MDRLQEVTYVQAAVAVGAIYTFYSAATTVYRLFFHPLRNIPGPKLAAVTRWVETYYNCFKGPGGQFMWAYQKWHEKYGPIVRIGPNEVHIQDITFYETIYAHSRHSNKPKEVENRLNVRYAAFETPEHDLHRLRRGALNPFFSKRKMGLHSPNIQEHMDRLCERVASEFVAENKVLNLNNMFGAFTTDIVVSYCLEQPYNFINNPDFRADFSDSMVDLLDPVHWVTHFRSITEFLRLLPDWLMRIISPPMGSVIDFTNEVRRQIEYAKAVHKSEKEKPKDLDAAQSMFAALLDSDLPPAELSTEHLQHEAMALIAAGVETTMYALSTGSFHLLANPEKLHKLKAELAVAIPDPAHIPPLNTLMQLPYLTAVVYESIRFAYGTVQRLPRLSPTPIVYSTPEASYTVPVGCVISMDNYSSSHDAWAFPAPYDFIPERWEGNPHAPDGKVLTRYLISFSRGTRSCVGMQMAYADMYIGLASFFRRFDCELFETSRDAVDCYLDKFVPRPKPGTKGVRVKVANAVEKV